VSGIEAERHQDPRDPATLAHLRALVERTRPVTTADQRVLPVLAAVDELLPGGLRRGSVVQVGGSVGATSLALALVAGPTQAGSWVACVGVDELGWAAAAAAGVDLEHLVVVHAPRPSWATVMAALVDAVDVVLCGLQHAPSAVEVRRLQARARERGTVLVVLGGRSGPAGVLGRGWPDAPDVGVRVVEADWRGLGQGWGHLQSRRVTVEVSGRRGHGRARRIDLLLPGPDGAPAAAPDRSEVAVIDGTDATVTPLRPRGGRRRAG
jgi:hypothetical protein